MNKLNNSHALWWWDMIKDELTPATLVVITILIIYAINVVRYKLKLSSTSPPLPPGPPSLPIVGYLPFLKPDMHKQLTDLSHTYGPIFKICIGSKLLVIINTPELVHEVVRTHDDIFANRDLTIAVSVFSYGGQHVAFSKNDSKWRKHRKIFVQELLSKKSLEACSCFRIGGVRKTINDIFRKIGTKVNISEIAFSTQENVVMRMIWDNSLAEDSNVGADDDLHDLSSSLSGMIEKPNVSDFIPSLAWFDLQGIERNMRRQRRKLEYLLKSIIDNRVKFNSKRSEESMTVADSKKKDFLQILLDIKENKDSASLSNIEMYTLMMGIMLGATETTTTTVEWAMTEIIKNRHVMKRIQQELTEIVGEDNIVEEFHLEKLQYLDATVKETHRLHPIGPFLIPRVPSKDCIVGGYTIPKDSSVFLNVRSIQRDPRYWDNPLEFNPERFLSTSDGTSKYDYKGNNMIYLPFGSGRRICPGVPLAEKMQMLTLASLLHSFDWKLPEGEEHDFSEIYAMGLKKTKPLVAIPSQRLHHVNLYA